MPLRTEQAIVQMTRQIYEMRNRANSKVEVRARSGLSLPTPFSLLSRLRQVLDQLGEGFETLAIWMSYLALPSERPRVSGCIGLGRFGFGSGGGVGGAVCAMGRILRGRCDSDDPDNYLQGKQATGNLERDRELLQALSIVDVAVVHV
jgi:hypothetical protein